MYFGVEREGEKPYNEQDLGVYSPEAFGTSS